MARRYEQYNRLEPCDPFADLERGFRAEVLDPVWFLARQWQMGEHQGEDASSPVLVRYRIREHPIGSFSPDPAHDPKVTPPEAIVEGETDEWWTPGRRIRLGRLLFDDLSPEQQADPTLLLEDLPVPYRRLNGRGLDGRKLFARRVELGLETFFATLAIPDQTDRFDYARFQYDEDFPCAERTLEVHGHRGGDVDWYAADADGPLPTTGGASETRKVYPGRMVYPGAPNPRWWQIEDREVDIGGYPPDRGHFATMLLIDLVVSHSDDWFHFPVQTRIGHAVTLESVEVLDDFDQTWTLAPPANWSLFRTRGLDPRTLLLWPTVATPIRGEPLEDVAVGLDEDANRVFAVELRVEGSDLPTAARPLGPEGPEAEVDATAPVAYDYRVTTGVPDFWHPYEVGTVAGRRRFVQGRMADLSGPGPDFRPAPRARVLRDPTAPAGQPPHSIEPEALPESGVRLERRYMLGRGTDSQPILWVQRRTRPLLAPPVSGLRFDVLRQRLPRS